MPRVRLTAGRWLALAAASAGLWLSSAHAAPPAPAAARAAAARLRPGETDARRRGEIDALQRQDAAEALKKHFNIDVDWRTTTLDRLVDIRARAAKACELQLRLGVSVDWQRYSWIELEALRRTLISFERYRDQHAAVGVTAPSVAERFFSPTDDALVPPTFKDPPADPGTRRADPDGILRPTFRPIFTGRATQDATTDPDGVIRPTFVFRPRWSSIAADPDGLIAPTFVPVRRLSLGGADDLIDPTRTLETRTAPTRW